MIRLRNYLDRGHRLVNERYVVTVESYSQGVGSVITMADGRSFYSADTQDQIWEMIRCASKRHQEPYAKRRDGKQRRAERRFRASDPNGWVG